MSFYFILFNLIWFIFFSFVSLFEFFVHFYLYLLSGFYFILFFYHYYFILNIYGWSFCLLFQDIFFNVLHLFPSSCLNFVNHFFTFFNNFLLHSFLNDILILSIVDKCYLVFYRPTSFSFTLNVYILSIVYLYLQLWCPFEEGDLNIICFVLNTDLFYGFCFYFIYCTTLALCLWSSSIKSMFLNINFFPIYILNLKLDVGPLLHAWKQRRFIMLKNKQTNKKTLNWNWQIHAYHLSSLVIIWVNSTTTQ